VATFGDLSIARAGTGYTITASSGAFTSATSSAFDITAGAGSRLVFRVAPSSTTAGSPLGNVSVELQDASGNRVDTSRNITVELQGGQGATLAGTTTVAANAGVALFSDLSVNRAGTGYRLVAHADQATSATSSAFDISHGPAAALAFTVQPSNSSAGRAISPAVKVTLLDAFGNMAASATDSVTIALGNNPRNGTLSGTRTVSAINGVATFSDLSINRKGEGYTLVASSGALTGATSAAFDITPGRGPKLVISTVPSQVTAGEALPSIDVELQDEFGNAFSDSAASVALSLGDNTAGGQLFGRTTVVVSNGVARFDSIVLRKAGNGYTLVASAQGFESATSTAFSVSPAAAANYALTFPASVTAGQEASLSATAYDAYGNQAANYGGTVNVTSSDAAATLNATATFAEGKFESFKVTFRSTGLRTLTVTDSANASLKATAQLNVTPFAQPTVTVTEPEGGTNVSGSVRISAEGAVAAGTTVTKLQILVDGKEIASGTEATLSGNWNSEEAEGGSHVITAIVTDGAGNIVNSAPVIVFTEMGGCGCGATSGTEASFYLALLVLARYVLGRRRKADAA
jgi:MYXO-CTERM domain-containing protein